MSKSNPQSGGTDYLPLAITAAVGVGLYLLVDNVKDLFGAGRGDKKEDKAANAVEQKAVDGDVNSEAALNIMATLEQDDYFEIKFTSISELNTEGQNALNKIALTITDITKASAAYRLLGDSRSHFYNKHTGNLLSDMQSIMKPAQYAVWLIYAKSHTGTFAFQIGQKVKVKPEAAAIYTSPYYLAKTSGSVPANIALGAILDRAKNEKYNLYQVLVQDIKTKKNIKVWIFGTKITKA
jgi:hypothetical protein